jgi:ribosomal protein S18 acetylase RimI-like enzyme
MPDLRPYRADDLDALYRICLQTGDAGQDATSLYADPKLLGHVYTGAYAALSPETVFVIEDGEGVGGYIVGPADTRAFEARCRKEWWPPLRERYADPGREPATPDARMQRRLHRPDRTPDEIAVPYPAHLHINLLPRLQGQGLGRALIDRWREAVRVQGAQGMHLGVGTRNDHAVRFYRAYGFGEFRRYGEVIVFALAPA